MQHLEMKSVRDGAVITSKYVREAAMAYFVVALSMMHEDQADVRHVGEYDDLDDAIKAAQGLIDAFLRAAHEAEMTLADLFAQYQQSSEMPFIFGDDVDAINVGGFNHFKYAINKCAEMCVAY